MNIHLDITTKSKVYNPLSAKGQWIHHRFGKRNLDLELEIGTIEKVLSNSEIDHITLFSIYGDPLDHTHIVDVLDCINNYGKSCTICTYGMNSDAIKVAKEYNFSLFIKVCDKVFLNQELDIVVKNCQDYNNVMLENTVFKHTDNNNVETVCKENNWQYFTTPGMCISGFCSSIIDEKGNWLYDVHSTDHEGSTLVKTTKGWHRLKMFVKPMLGKSILDNPIIITKDLDISDMMTDNKDIVVTVSGHVIKNMDRAVVFSNALCSDWDANQLRHNEPYEAYIGVILSEFSRSNLDEINLNKLSSFADCNI